ncbi:hypothetical protein RP20_CCG004420 [Aedes albopictus]|nr:hypothetical protein RP20_CCG004420 [Aedes albopictus]
MLTLRQSLSVVILLLYVSKAFLQNPTSEKEPSSKEKPKINRLYINTLKYVNETKDVELIAGVFDAILTRLDKLDVKDAHERNIGRYDLTTLLCWTVNNDFLNDSYKRHEKKLFQLSEKFYPERDDKAKTEREIEGRKPCRESFPLTTITGRAWMWKLK